MAFKTNLHVIYETDKVMEDEGVEVSLGEDIFIRVRSFKSERVQEAHRRLQEPFKHLIRRGKTIPENNARDILLQLIAGYVIVGWRGLTDEKGKTIPYSPHAAKELLEELPHVADILVSQATDIATFQTELDEEAEGN